MCCRGPPAAKEKINSSFPMIYLVLGDEHYQANDLRGFRPVNTEDLKDKNIKVIQDKLMESQSEIERRRNELAIKTNEVAHKKKLFEETSKMLIRKALEQEMKKAAVTFYYIDCR